MENTQSHPIDGVRNGISDLQDQISSSAAQAKDRLNAAGSQAKGQAKEAVKSVVAFTKERPLAAIGIAVGAGLLLGALFKGRR